MAHKIGRRREFLYKMGVLGRSMNCASLPPLLTPNSALLTFRSNDWSLIYSWRCYFIFAPYLPCSPLRTYRAC